MSESKHPELSQFIRNLCEAGMSMPQVIEHGYTFAENLTWEETRMVNAMQQAALVLLEVTNELEISLAHQRQVKDDLLRRRCSYTDLILRDRPAIDWLDQKRD